MKSLPTAFIGRVILSITLFWFSLAIMAARASGTVTNGYISAVLRSQCTSDPVPPPPVGDTRTGTDYVIMTVADGNPRDFANAQQVATDAIFQSLMPLYCALPKTNCVTDSVQWSIITYDTNGNPVTSGCAASGCQLHSCSAPAVTNGYITAVLRSQCASDPVPPPPVGDTRTGANYVIMTVADGNPRDFANAQQVATDAIFQSLMPLYCALPKTNCVTDSVQWNIITYDTNGNPVTSGCAVSGCQFHSCSGGSQTLPPVLAASSGTANLKLYWSTMASDFVLEESTNLINWYPAPWPTATNVSSISTLVPSHGGRLFFRLRHQ